MRSVRSEGCGGRGEGCPAGSASASRRNGRMPRSSRARRQASRARDSSSSGSPPAPAPAATSVERLRSAVTRRPTAAQNSPAAATAPKNQAAVSSVSANTSVGASTFRTAPTSRNITAAVPESTGARTVRTATMPAPGPALAPSPSATRTASITLVPLVARPCVRTLTKWSYSTAAAAVISAVALMAIERSCSGVSRFPISARSGRSCALRSASPRMRSYSARSSVSRCGATFMCIPRCSVRPG